MARIAIFDSGVGGLSIYNEIRARTKDQEFVFVSDNLAFPYGLKEETRLNHRVLAIMHRIVTQFKPDIVVIACNTASTLVLPLLRETFDLPIVGVVPAIKPAALISKTRHIGLLATPATIKRNYTDQLIKDFAADCVVTKVGSSQLVELAECKLYGLAVDIPQLKHQIKPLLAEKNCDTLVLACTHFPLLNSEINEIFEVDNHPMTLIDSGRGIANRVAKLIAAMPDSTFESMAGTAIFTKRIDGQAQFIQNLDELGLTYQGVLD